MQSRMKTESSNYLKRERLFTASWKISIVPSKTYLRYFKELIFTKKYNAPSGKTSCVINLKGTEIDPYLHYKTRRIIFQWKKSRV